MKLTLIRFASNLNDTLGLLFIDDKFAGFTLEDEYREVKVAGETRIPAGEYNIKYTYSPKYGKLMLEVMNVPNFTGIRIHPGNTEADTSGCLLIGNFCNYNPSGDSWIGESKIAYERVSALIIHALGKGESVVITIKDSL